MRFLILALLAIFIQTVTPGTAEARRGGKKQELVFIEETQFPGAGGKFLSLCHLVTIHTVLFIPLVYSSNGYVLADNRCDADQYSPVDDELFQKMKQVGAISADLPNEPSLGFSQRFISFLVIGSGSVIILAGLFITIRLRKNRKKRHAIMGNVSDFSVRVLDVMCHAAKSDGEITPHEVKAIASATEKLIDQTFSFDQIIEMIRLSETNLQPSTFSSFGKRLTSSQKEMLMRGALMVVTADGEYAKAEHKFINGLAHGLKIKFDQIQVLLDELTVSNPNPPAT